MGRDSSVGIATRYGLDGTGIESRWGQDFSHPSRPALGPTQPPVQWVKRPGRFADHPRPSKRRGHERVGLYLYSPSVPSWPVIGRILHFYPRKGKLKLYSRSLKGQKCGKSLCNIRDCNWLRFSVTSVCRSVIWTYWTEASTVFLFEYC